MLTYSQYDNVTAPPAGVTNPIPLVTYQGVNYTGFIAGSVGAASAVAPASPDKVIANGPLARAQTGPATLRPAEPYNAMDIISMYVACVFSGANGAVSTTTNCTLRFTGTARNGATVSKTLVYTGPPVGAIQQPMQYVVFPGGFTNIDLFKIELVSSTTTKELTSVWGDDVRYRLRN